MDDRATVPVNPGRMMRRATLAAIALAATLIIAKAIAFAATGSLAMLSSLTDSLLDGFASLVTAWAVRVALIPADDEHRFGHGKAEPLAALAQAAFITGSGVLLLVESVQRLRRPVPVENEAAGIAVMVLASGLTLALVIYQRRVVRLSGSLAIDADSLHYRGDLMMNAGVILALLLAGPAGLTLADPLIGAAIALYLMVSAWSLARRSVDVLMDREWPAEERERLLAIALSEPLVRGVHDLRTRVSGLDRFAQMHLEMDGALPLRDAHAVALAVERKVAAAFPNVHVIIHQDPQGMEQEPHAHP